MSAHSHSHAGHSHGADACDGHAPQRPSGPTGERRKDAIRLGMALGLTATIAVAEVIGGYVSRSLALMADAGHMFTDVSALGLSLLAVWFAARPANPS